MRWHPVSGGLLLALSLLVAACGAGADTPPLVRQTALPMATATSAPRSLVVDTDMAADDWMALVYLLRRPDVAVKAITVSGTGEAHCAPGVHQGCAMRSSSSPSPIAP
jgi:hypothetical protein